MNINSVNPILDTDSYKSGHYLQYPPQARAMYSYIESRGGVYNQTVFFGLQYFLKTQMMQVPSLEDLQEAKDFFAARGEPFPEAGWKRIIELGYYPVRIRAVPEGTVVPTHNLLLDIESTDPGVDDALTFWIASWLETKLLRAIWYPTTVATKSWHCKRVILKHLRKSSDDPQAEIGFKLHDFGARGASSEQTAAIGGAAHLVNFMGTDTISGALLANKFYNSKMSGFSIPAAEHSSITSWGRDSGEVEAYRNMLKQFAKPGSMVAVVSDSYDIFNAVENIWCGELLEEVKVSGATVVIRPDSGDPAEVNVRILQIMDRKLGGLPKNSKGFKVLPSYFRIIQGDGNKDETSIDRVLNAIENAGFSASNIAFGMGGGLLQMVDRDTQKFAFKCSAIQMEDCSWHDVSKSPVTDPGKKSKVGRMELILDRSGNYQTVRRDMFRPHDVTETPVMRTVYVNGKILVDDTLDAIRQRSVEGL